MDPRVEKIEQLMRDNVQREWSLPELAQTVNLSVWRLSHIFVSEVGKSPMQYLRQLRMDRARYLLETSFLSVKEIAHQVGLNDESHFVRDFKKLHGDAPTRYRLRSRSDPMNSGNGENPDDQKIGDEANHGNEPPRPANQELAKAVRRSLLLFLNFLSYWASTFDGGI
ncbi:MAG TPA: AraC family transcriptional regulator [Pyrinomonadaceae bacterium]|nr:AraC family transcriptional regulator [Pyrinomonadaceae bacterium]